MAYWKFTGAVAEYFPTIGLTAKPGQVYDFGSAVPPGENIPREGVSPTITSNWTSDPGPATDFLLSGRQASDVAAVPSGSTFATLRVGGAYQAAFTAEMGQDNDGIVSDLSFVRIRARASRGTTSPSSFYGETALRVEYADTASVVDSTTAPYGYAGRFRVAPRVNRTQSGIDDIVGVVVVNKSYGDYGTTFNGTEAIYVGNGGDPAFGKEWNAGLGIETVADKGIYITSPQATNGYQYGILMVGTTFSGAAIRIPNGTSIVGRNAGDTANVSIAKIDSSDRLSLKSDAMIIDGSGNVLINTTSANFAQTTPKGFQVRSIDGTTVEINASADTAASATSAVYAKGRAGSSDVVARMQANSAGDVRIGSESSHAVKLRFGGSDKLILNTASVTIADPYDFVLGTTTGTKFGTATTQKLAFWNKTPIVQPTTAVAAAAFVANTGTAVVDTSTFGGYTIKQVVQALQNLGLLA